MNAGMCFFARFSYRSAHTDTYYHITGTGSDTRIFSVNKLIP